eukprot:4781027-Pyramimonas_sp.AAC.1
MLVRVVCSLARECNKCHVPWVLENPRTSRLWLVDEIRILERKASSVVLDYCMYGMPWRKCTRFVGTLPGLESWGRRCTGRVCRRTGHRHQALEGKDPSGAFWTRRAEPYPTSLCNAISSSVVASLPPLPH